MLTELQISVYHKGDLYLDKKFVFIGTDTLKTIDILNKRGFKVNWDLSRTDYGIANLEFLNTSVYISFSSETEGDGLIIINGDEWIIEALIDKVIKYVEDLEKTKEVV